MNYVITEIDKRLYAAYTDFKMMCEKAHTGEWNISTDDLDKQKDKIEKLIELKKWVKLREIDHLN